LQSDFVCLKVIQVIPEAKMAASIPYVLATGLIPKVLEKIQEARRPDRFTQDFLKTKLGFSSGHAMALIPLLKRIGFLGSDGAPTELYDQFRNTHSQGSAMARALKIGFKDIYDRNEYAQDLPKEKLASLITQITGAEKDSRVVSATVSTFCALKSFADFEAQQAAIVEVDDIPNQQITAQRSDTVRTKPSDNVDLKLSYTINLNLPETSNPQVFNAIFKSLKENLLKE
jgi:hypothetical protein